MKKFRYQAALLVSILGLATPSASWAQAKKAKVSAKVTASPSAPTIGKNVALTMVTTSQAPVKGIVYLGVFDAKNKRIAQKEWQNETLAKGTRTFKWNWKPSAKGVYTVQSGVFGPKWKPTHHFGWRAVKMTVK